MRFYRLATEEDFAKNPFDEEFPAQVIELIKNGEISKAIHQLRVFRGMGLQECKKYCQQYQSFIRAKEDFSSGKPVYTDY